jgi:thiamine-phosphate pyrophosphorylase
MANDIASRCRLCLVTPAGADAETFARHVADALSGGDVASLIVAAHPGDPAALQRAAQAFVPIAQDAGTAAILQGDTRIVGRTQADGVLIDTGPADLAAAVAAMRPKRMIGAAGIASRHDALTAGEASPDFLFFGRLDGDIADGVFPKALDLAAWWSAVTVIPAVVMGGGTLASVREAAREGIEFVALSRAVWNDPRGPRAAVAEACELLALAGEAAA